MTFSETKSRFRQGGAPPEWMPRAQRWMFAVSVVLGLAVCAVVWTSAIDGPAALDRIAMEAPETGNRLSPFELSIRKLLLFGLLVACSLLVWWRERELRDRFEPWVLAGTLLVVLAQLNGSEGARWAGWRAHVYAFRPHQLDVCLVLGVIGAIVLLGALLRVATRPARRGAVIAGCALFLVLCNLWWAHHFLVAPTWAQRGAEYAVEDLAFAPASRVLYVIGGADESPTLLELAEQDREVSFFARLSEVEREHVREHVVNMLPYMLFEDTAMTRRRRRAYPLWLRVDADLTGGQVLPVLEHGYEVGISDFILVVRKIRPWVVGTLQVWRPDDPNAAVLELRVGDEGHVEFRFEGQESTRVSELVPWMDLDPALLFSERERLVVAVDPDASWQDIVSTLDAIGCIGRQVSLALLEE